MLDVAVEAARALVLQPLARVAQAIEGRLRVRLARALPARAGAAHRVGRILQAAGGLLHRGRGLLAREPLEAAGQLLGLLGELALRPAAGPAQVGRAAGLATHALALLLLPLRQLAQPLEGGVHLVVGLLLLAALDGLVLVLELVQLQLEQIGQLLRVHGRVAAGLAFVAEAHLDLAERGLRPLQVLERPLLRGERLLRLPGLQLAAGGGHLHLGRP